MRRSSPIIVIGFLGGYLPHDDPVRSEVRLAKRLRADYTEGVRIETFENRRYKAARKTILHLLGARGDATLSNDEKRAARIISYGHSWGGAAVVKLARLLEKDEIPVQLTVQVDSIGRHDDVIPSNVRRAANFYQRHGLVRGRAPIHAADPARTQIIGNFRLDYKNHCVDCSALPWYEPLIARTHSSIACDPAVWSQVETLIRKELQAPNLK